MRYLISPLLFLTFTVMLPAQAPSPTCVTTAVPSLLRAEGVAERLGDIVMSCNGTAGTTITGNLTVFINTTITNRILGTGDPDVVVTVNGTTSLARASLQNTNGVSFSGLQFVFGTDGKSEVRISNLRGDATFGGSPASGNYQPAQAIVAQLAFNPGGVLNFTNTNFQVGVPQRSLYSTSIEGFIPSQLGSAIPDDLSFTSLIAFGTIFASTRISEGYISAFEARQPNSDSGIRVQLSFTGLPADARLFVPALVAGSDAQTPTVAGDFGGTVSPGSYLAGSRTLLLGKVVGHDANGAGGAVAAGSASSLTLPFGAMTEVTLTGGSGSAVFEVLDSNPLAQESAQVPVFIALPRSPTVRTNQMREQVLFAPISTSSVAAANAPVPRFANIPAQLDCQIYQDCASFFPKLGAQPLNTQFRLIQGVGAEERVIRISNEAGGRLPWTARVEYARGADWILLDPLFAPDVVPIRMVVRALANLAPGTYTATVVIDAGLAGTARYPVTLEIVALPVVQPTPMVSSVLNGATFEPGPVAPGSYVTLKGSNLTGTNLTVTFGGLPAKVVYSGSDQINVLVPASLPTGSSQVVVSVNGRQGAAVPVTAAGANPGIFTPGILNQDGGVNSSSNPANTGTTVQIFATGLLAANGTGQIDAHLHDRDFSGLPYAGAAPGIEGLQQVNIRIPEGWPTMMTHVALCTTAGGTRQCSPPVEIYLRQAQ